MMETRSRSVAKTLTWRGLAVCITTGVAWLMIGELRFAAAIGLADMLVKVGVYYGHERVWNRVCFGRAPQPEYEI
jgi:uncharacterized membrane protein